MNRSAMVHACIDHFGALHLLQKLQFNFRCARAQCVRRSIFAGRCALAHAVGWTGPSIPDQKDCYPLLFIGQGGRQSFGEGTALYGTCWKEADSHAFFKSLATGTGKERVYVWFFPGLQAVRTINECRALPWLCGSVGLCWVLYWNIDYCSLVQASTGKALLTRSATTV